MKIYTEVLSESLLYKCKDDLVNNKLKQPVWSSSSNIWDFKLLKNIEGVCIQTLITDNEIIENLKEELSPAFEELNYKDLTFQYYVWDSHSGISLHNDYSYSFGSTIYLNKTFCPEDGGLFLWRDSECPTERVYKALVPDENMMVLNDEKEYHLVTPVSPHAKEYRCTIQIWGT